MTVPLARLLTRFPVAEALIPDLIAEEPPPERDPVVAALEAQLEESRRAAEAQTARRIADLEAQHTGVLTRSLAEARAQWCATEAASLSERIDAGLLALRSYLSEQIADVLKPLLGEALTIRTRDRLIEAIDLALADPIHPYLTVRAPGDLVDAIRKARPDVERITYVAHDAMDAIVTAEGLRLETHLEAALIDLVEC